MRKENVELGGRWVAIAAALAATVVLGAMAAGGCKGEEKQASPEQAAAGTVQAPVKAPAAAGQGAAAPADPAQAMAQAMQAAAQAAAPAGGEQPNPAQAMAQAMQAMSQAVAGPDGKPVNVVSWEQILPLLPPPPAGWTAGEPRGETTSFGAMRASQVQRRYENGGQKMSIKIVDSSFNPMAMQAFRMVQLVQESSTEGYKKGQDLGGHPAIEEWRKDGGRAKLTAVVADRFIVEVEGSPLPDAGPVKSLFLATNLSGLAALR